MTTIAEPLARLRALAEVLGRSEFYVNDTALLAAGYPMYDGTIGPQARRALLSGDLAAVLPPHGFVPVPAALPILLDTAVRTIRDFVHDEVDPTASVVSALDDVCDALAPYLVENPDPPPAPDREALAEYRRLSSGSLQHMASCTGPSCDCGAADELRDALAEAARAALAPLLTDAPPAVPEGGGGLDLCQNYQGPSGGFVDPCRQPRDAHDGDRLGHEFVPHPDDADEQACALCGEAGEFKLPLRWCVAANGERMLAHQTCWEWPDLAAALVARLEHALGALREAPAGADFVALTQAVMDAADAVVEDVPTSSREEEPVTVAEGWWHPNVNAGRVHDHPERPNRSWSVTMHRSCELVYTRRTASPPTSTREPGA